MASKFVLKYGIPRGICGVYMIKNKITNDFYIGSSNDISSRLSTHFGRDKLKYPNNPLYQAINKFKFEDFEFIILKQCSKKDKILLEQYYYDKLKPTYNIVRTT